MTLDLILTVLAVFLLLVGLELWCRLRKPNSEISRKFIHIIVGSLAAFWPFYLSWNTILLLSGAFLVVVVISKYVGIFRAIHAVQRPTWGEMCFALAVGILALVTRQPWIYAAALLHMSLADGLAAILGVNYGRTNRYKVFGHTKSVAGTLTFFVASLAILTIYAWQVPDVTSGLVLVSLAVVATTVENVAVRGLDNLFVPLVVAVVLTSLK